MKKFEIEGKKIWISGHTGMVGSSVLRALKNKKVNILLSDRKNLDLTNQQKVFDWVEENKPDIVIMCSAKVGGIYANSTMPASFIYDNIIFIFI